MCCPGIYIGGGLAALSVIADQQLGWRGLSALAATAGVAASLVVFATLPPLPPSAGVADEEGVATEKRELMRGDASPPVASSSEAAEEAPSDEAPSVGEALSELLGTAGVRWLLIGSTLRFMAGFSVGVWIVPFFRSEFPTQIGAEFALLKARAAPSVWSQAPRGGASRIRRSLPKPPSQRPPKPCCLSGHLHEQPPHRPQASVNGVAGAVSAIGGGVLTDRLARNDSRFEQWVPAAGSLLAIPFWLATLHAGSLVIPLVCRSAQAPKPNTEPPQGLRRRVPQWLCRRSDTSLSVWARAEGSLKRALPFEKLG